MTTSSRSPSPAGYTDGSVPATLFAVTHTAVFGTLSRPRLTRSSRPIPLSRPGALLVAPPLLAPSLAATPSPAASVGLRPPATTLQPSPTSSQGLLTEWQKQAAACFREPPREQDSADPHAALVLPPRKSSRSKSQGAAPTFINPFAGPEEHLLEVPQSGQPLGVNSKAHKSSEDVASRLSAKVLPAWPSENVSPTERSATPLIVPPPTLGVVAMVPGSRAGPQMWPQFMERLGELSYLCAYPGEKRRDRCAEWLRLHGHGPIDGLLGKDISELVGSQKLEWLVSPTVKRSRSNKLRYAVNRLGEWKAVVEVQSTEAVVQHIERAMGRRSLSLYGEDPIAALTPHWGQKTSAIHFAHSLVMGEVFGQHQVADVINLHGKLYGVISLFDSISVAQLLQLAGNARKVFARRMFLSLAKILRDMHLRQAVHFNVCLSNVLLAAGSCTLSGFTSSHFIGSSGLPSDRVPTHEPPEMAAHRSYDCSVDVWGLGMALMRLLCGEQAFLVHPTQDHDQDLSRDVWQTYVEWHSGPRRGSLDGQQAPATSVLHQQLDAGFAAAAKTDRELAYFIVQHMIVPGVDRRLQKDALVTRAAQFCQAIPMGEQERLDEMLATTEPPLAPHPRPDILERMRRLLPVWRAQA